jgi:hypothetical protein
MAYRSRAWRTCWRSSAPTVGPRISSTRGSSRSTSNALLAYHFVEPLLPRAGEQPKCSRPLR